MKEIKRYTCELCGTEYKDKEKAIECEACHKKPLNIINVRYLPKANNKAGYPVRIEIEFDDHEKVIYQR